MSIVSCVTETQEPIGLFLTRTARGVSRAFEATLAGAGGSLPTWLVLASLKGGLHGSQREIAEAIGVEGPTLTHHLNRMESAGLVTRTRNPRNRRVHDVEVTDDGHRLFLSLVAVVQDFDRQLRAGLDDADLATLRRLLQRFGDNVAAGRHISAGGPTAAPEPRPDTVRRPG
jgi:MarR family transcriptional regulator, transcriptional regulator for hemolysin